MRHSFRLLETGADNAFYNMGLDEAILESVASGQSLPTLRIYGWKPAAISLGYFQGALDEADLEACRLQCVDLVRRTTGGGAVFHADEVTYSIVIPEGHPLAPESILESYSLICAGIVTGLGEIGVEAEFAPINDILSGGKKISGNAQTRKQNCLLQHGTLLLKVDVERMFSLLKVPKEKALGKMIADVKSRVSSLETILGREIEYKEAAAALVKGFALALDLDLIPDHPSKAEVVRAGELAAKKFSTEAWTFRR
ncbi:MAG: biotin/lipoate A/B protein ligase family protein [Spirochaetes bacterium]|nr:biotin/lipoate A/B protein ligase family protein [Spirochaetota bacterium]